MPVQDYLEVTGMPGPTSSAAFFGAFDITGFAFSVESAASLSSSFSVGRPEFGALQVSFHDLTGMTAFLSKLATGGALAQVSVVETDPTGAAEALRINLANAQVTEVAQAGTSFTVTLEYGGIGVIASHIAPDGSQTAPDSFGYSPVTGLLGAPPPNAIPSGVVAAVDATKFYLLIDGVTGDSKDAGHVGWFELTAVDLKALNELASVGTGQLTGKALVEPLSLVLGDTPGIADLLRTIASGRLIAGARIEGVTDGATPVVTYDLNLATVALTHIGQDDGKTTLDLVFGAFQLSTSGGQSASWNFQTNTSRVTLPAIAPGTGETGAVNPTEFFLNTGSIKGSSVDALHPGSLQVTGFSFGVDAQVNITSASSGAVPSKPDFGEVQISFKDEAGLDGFLADLTTGRRLGDVTLAGSQLVGGHEADTYKLTLANAMVTAVTDTSDGGYTVSLAYTRFGIVTTPLQANGAPGAPVSFGYDLAARTLGAAPTPVAAPGGGINVVPVDKYYLLVDGVNGGSVDPGHVGWFELSSYDLEALNNVLTSIGGAGKASAQPLDVKLEASTGVTQLLSKLASGGVISGARIEGVTGASGGAQAVYDLNLVGVTVSHVDQTQAGQADVSLAFNGFSLTTAATSLNGTVTTPAPVTWNFETNAPDVTLPSIAPATAPGGAPAPPTDYYFSISGVRGDVITQGFAGALDVQSFKFAADVPVGASGKADFGPLTVTFINDTGLNTFLHDLVTQANVANASLVGVGPTRQETYRLNLANMTVTDVHQNIDGGYSVTLSYGQIGVITHAVDARGAPLAAQQFGWSQIAETAITPPPNFTAPGGAESVNPTTFYVLIDGVNGGSTDAGHVGWFKISGFDLEALTQLTSPHATPAPLTFDIEGASGLTDLLTQLASSHLIDGARIEGVAGGSHPTVVYTLDLVDVAVQNLGVISDGQYTVNLAFGAFKLTTVGLASDGSTTPAQTTAWNFETNNSMVTVPPIAPGPGPGPGNGAPPPAPTSLEIDASAGVGSQGGHLTNAHTLTIDGAAQAGATVKILDGTTLVGTGVADANGAFQISITLADGTHSLSATATSSSGVTGAPSAPFSLTVDSTPPAAPTGLALDASTDSGAAGDGHTSATQLKIDGHAEAGSHVTLYDGQTALGSAVADSSGGFQITTSALANGAHTLTATATDAAGNLGPASTGLAVTVETLSLAADAGGHAVAELPGITGAATIDAATATLAFTDADPAATHSVQVAAPTLLWSGGPSLPPAVLSGLSTGLTSATLTDAAGGGSVAVSLHAPDGAFDFLAAGETLTVTSLVTVTGSTGGVDQQPVSFTVTGANDAPALAADSATHALTAGGGGSDQASATLAFTDADLHDQHTASVAAPTLAWSAGSPPPAGLAQTLAGALTTSLTDTGAAGGPGQLTAAFSAPDSAFAFLGQGETLTVTYPVTVTDSQGATSSRPVTFVVTGTNDAPVVAAGSTIAATVAEQAGQLGSTTLDAASGLVTFHDPDLSDRPSVQLSGQTIVAHTAGGDAFALTAAQLQAFAADFHYTSPAAASDDAQLSWSFSAQDRALDFLGAGESVTVTSTFVVDDHHGGTLSQPVTITLQGANDAPTAAADAAAVQRGGALAADKAHGVLANDGDPDAHDVLQVTAVNGQAAGVGGAVAGAYGVLTLKGDGSYSYAISKTAALPSSGVGQDVFTYQVSDGHGGVATQSLAVTVYAGGGGTSYLAGVPGVIGLSGGNGKGVLDAGVGVHVLQGGNGADVLVAGFGADTMTGGNGPDVFVFAHNGFGATVITDFAKSDSIQLDHHLFANFADVVNHAAQVGHDVVITLDAQDTITLQGVTLASLRSSDFLFV